MIRWACGAYKERYTKQSCSFWPRYAPNRLSAGASPQSPLGSLQHPKPLDGLGGGVVRGRGTRDGRGGKGKKRGKKGKREDGIREEAEHPRFSDGLTPLDRIIAIIYQDGYDGRLVVGLSCLTEWVTRVYSRYFFNQPIRSKEQLWWQQFLWIFDLTFFYKTYVLAIALTANLVDVRY